MLHVLFRYSQQVMSRPFIRLKVLCEYPVFSLSDDRLSVLGQKMLHTERAHLITHDFLHDGALKGGACVGEVNRARHI